MDKSSTLKISHFYGTLIISVAFILSSCSSTKQAKLSKRPVYQQIIENSSTFNSAYTGFVLFNPSTSETLYQRNASRYFTPASNTKIFTLFTSLKVLGDSIPAIRYTEKGDSLTFWGTGDPSLNNPNLSENNRLVNFLKNTDKKLYFNPGNFADTKFGAGWSWDDYYYYYMPEKSPMPFHGNVIKVNKIKDDPYFRVEPGYFSSSFSPNEKITSRWLKRVSDYNIFEYNPSIQKKAYDNEHPFLTSNELLINLLQESTSKSIKLNSESELPDSTKVFFGIHTDTLYRQMMQASDNFIAEQLLLLCSDELFRNLNSEQVINYAVDSLMNAFPDEPIWVDGSGLSRYNLFTPRTVVHILTELYKDLPRERLFHIMAQGGVVGTIKNWYAGENGPFVFAKTGTLSNNHCLSGYLLTKRGEVLIFSFMHNNFKGSSKPYKEEMEKVLREIYLQY